MLGSSLLSFSNSIEPTVRTEADTEELVLGVLLNRLFLVVLSAGVAGFWYGNISVFNFRSFLLRGSGAVCMHD